MERERERHLTEFDTFGEKLREFIDTYPSVFYGVNTWWISGYEDWQFIYDHLDDYNKFKIKQWNFANDQTCSGESQLGYCDIYTIVDEYMYADYLDNNDPWLSDFENVYQGLSYQGIVYQLYYHLTEL